ncbi:2-C-methyl-D-erythritol 4-phosphate cytidylyltransferase [Shouchella clausii]|uniref:2-C-methyl-D-erythritol 4-phosphate cytidylyltransferase n=1 Tax=Shouchella clausii TaxID=79880 RepID=UPI0039835A67
MEYAAIVLAAGQGKRMKAGMNKQLIDLNGIPLIVHSLRLFEEDAACKAIWLVVSEPERQTMEKLVAEYRIGKVKGLVNGGAERQDSVYAGLKGMEEAEIVLIHDGARPFVAKPILTKLVDEAAQSGAAIAAVPVKDTVKLANKNSVARTVERKNLWAAQTPQAFQYELVLAAHEDAKKHGFIGTDDASLVERLDKQVTIVESDYLNIKLTTEEDLLFAETILKKRENQL